MLLVLVVRGESTSRECCLVAGRALLLALLALQGLSTLTVEPMVAEEEEALLLRMLPAQEEIVRSSCPETK